MNEIHLSLNVEETELLGKLLEREIEQKLIEEHRTRAPSYRQYIEHDESVLREVLKKLHEAATVEVVE